MRVLLINSVCGIGSTGRICTDLLEKYKQQGHMVKIAFGRKASPQEYSECSVRIGNDFGVKLQGIQTRIFDNHGFGNKRATAKFLKWADNYNPDLLWLHNIHGYYINVEMLFDWIKKRPKMQVKWTLHDCWAFTGHCAHFAHVDCERWKSGCSNCPVKREYPSSCLADNSKQNYLRKRKAFSGVENMTIITPSKWLADLVSMSFLKDYPTLIYNNTVDTLVFKPTKSDFRVKYGLEDKKIILGVAAAWNKNKGLFDFLELSKLLDDNYKIVLVGLSAHQIKEMNRNIIAIQKIESKEKLAELYSEADVFFNPTYADTYPTVNLEAEACSTPVITYRTGGAEETIHRDDSCAVDKGDFPALIENIIRISENQRIDRHKRA